MNADYTVTESICYFLLEQGLSVNSEWSGKLRKAEQMALFGRYFGRGTIIIDGLNQRVIHSIKVCFGTDSAWTAAMNFDGSMQFDNTTV